MVAKPEVVTAMFLDYVTSTNDLVLSQNSDVAAILGSIEEKLTVLSAKIDNIEKPSIDASELAKKLKCKSVIKAGTVLSFNTKADALNWVNANGIKTSDYALFDASSGYVKMGDNGQFGGNSVISMQNIPSPTGRSTVEIQAKVLFADTGQVNG